MNEVNEKQGSLDWPEIQASKSEGSYGFLGGIKRLFSFILTPFHFIYGRFFQPSEITDAKSIVEREIVHRPTYTESELQVEAIAAWIIQSQAQARTKVVMPNEGHKIVIAQLVKLVDQDMVNTNAFIQLLEELPLNFREPFLKSQYLANSFDVTGGVTIRRRYAEGS